MPALGRQLILRGDRWCVQKIASAEITGQMSELVTWRYRSVHRLFLRKILNRAQRSVVCLSFFAFVGVEQCSCETLCFLMMGYSDVVTLALKNGSSSKRDHESESSQDLLLSRDPKKLWFNPNTVVFADYKRLEKVHYFELLKWPWSPS